MVALGPHGVVLDLRVPPLGPEGQQRFAHGGGQHRQRPAIRELIDLQVGGPDHAELRHRGQRRPL